MKKNVLITGINGFVAGNLSKLLLKKGYNVFGLYRSKKRNSFIFYEKLDEHITLLQGDISDYFLMDRIITEENINIVFHLAAQVEVGIAQKNPFLTFETNIRGSYTLLDVLNKNSHLIDAIILASSDKSYGSYPINKMPYKEEYPLQPKFPYDISKACMDMIGLGYATDIFKLPIIVTRFSNIYGPGQLNFSALIPDLIKCSLGYGKFIPRSNGLAIRDFLFVDDVVNLYLKLLEKILNDKDKLRGQVFNAGCNKPIQVKDVISCVFDKIDYDNQKENIFRKMKSMEAIGEIDCQYMDYEKVYKFTNWSPTIKLDKGIDLSIDWYKNNIFK